MLREITDNYIIFRNVVSAKEGIINYPDGRWYKPADELRKVAENYDEVKLVAGTHEDFREIGKVMKPKYGKLFKRGQLIRDWIFDRSKMTPEEEKILLEGKKMDVSMGYDCDDIKMQGRYLDQQYDGVNTNIRPDHFLWTEQGRCSEQDGCGLRRTDAVETRRYDAIEMESCDDCEDLDLIIDMLKESKLRGDQKEGLKDCVKRKIPIIRKEHSDWDQTKIVAVAYSYCREKQRGDSMPDDKPDNSDSSPTENPEIKELKEKISSIEQYITELKELSKQIDKNDKETQQTSPPDNPPPSTPPTEVGKEEFTKILESIEGLNKKFDEIDVQFKAITAPPRSTTFSLKKGTDEK